QAPLPGGEIGVEEGHGRKAARVVYQQIDAAELGDGASRQGGELSDLGARAARDAGAQLGEGEGDAAADAAARTGDQRDTVGESEAIEKSHPSGIDRTGVARQG